MRSFCLVLCLFWGGVAGAAASAALPERAVGPAVVQLPAQGSALPTDWLAVRPNTASSLGIEQIAADRQTPFAPMNPALTYPLEEGNALWLHFRLRVDQPAALAGWTLDLTKPFIDRAEFYYQDNQGAWQMQAAGTRVPHAQWPVNGLQPQFHLPVFNAAGPFVPGVRDFYVKVQKWIPLRFAVQLQRTEATSQTTQNTFLAIGLTLGLLGLMFLFSCVLTVANGHPAYPWYALYVAAAWFSVASFSGMASYALWPHWIGWTPISTMVFVMLGMLAQLLFCRAMFAGRRAPALQGRLLLGAAGLTALALLLFVTVEQKTWRVALFGASVVAGFAVIGWVVASALARSRTTAVLYLLSFVPMLLVMLLTQLEQLGLVAVPWLAYNAPSYALLLELPLLLIALHLHAKDDHAATVRSHTLAQTDPLSGFVAPHLHDSTLSRLWNQAIDSHTDLAVAYVSATYVSHPAAHRISASAEHNLQRTVRLLRTVAREMDTITCVQNQVFAMVMPGVSRGEALNNKLSRLVALGVMTDSDDLQAGTVQFKIVVSTLATFSGSSRQLDLALNDWLTKPDNGTGRAIRFIRQLRDEPVEPMDSSLSGTAGDASQPKQLDAADSGRPMRWHQSQRRGR